MEAAWQVLLPKGAKAFDAAAFRQVLPLLGEEVPESQVSVLLMPGCCILMV